MRTIRELGPQTVYNSILPTCSCSILCHQGDCFKNAEHNICFQTFSGLNFTVFHCFVKHTVFPLFVNKFLKQDKISNLQDYIRRIYILYTYIYIHRWAVN